jgi:hypothetical protein
MYEILLCSQQLKKVTVHNFEVKSHKFNMGKVCTYLISYSEGREKETRTL